MIKNLFVYTLGCKVNWCDSDDITATAVKSGWTSVNNPRYADVCVINTCTVTSRADATARKIIRKLKKTNPNAALIVSGCYARTDSKTLKNIPEVSCVTKAMQPAGILRAIDKVFAEKQGNEILCEETGINFIPLSERTRSFIKIQDGCNQFCAYCKVPLARGKGHLYSVPVKDVLKKFEQLAEDNYKEVVLTGINVSAYKDKKNNLTDLLRIISEKEIIPRVRLSSVEGNAVNNELCEVFAGSNVLMPHLHIPLQCGSDKVLKIMNRKVKTSTFLKAAERLLMTVPDSTITTDVIVGLPGETEKDFKETINIINRIPFSKVHVFPYSQREGTAAAKMNNLFVHTTEIKKRERILTEHADKAARLCRKQFSGKTLKVLIENKSKGFWEGFSENYLRVKSTRKNLKNNEVFNLKINNTQNYFV